MAAALYRLAMTRPLANGTASAQPLLTPSCLSPVPAERCAPALRRAESAPRHRLATATPSPPHKAVADMTDAEKLDCIAAGIAPACGTRYVELSAAVFGGAVPVRPGEPGTRTGRKILRAPLKGPALMEWCVWPLPLLCGSRCSFRCGLFRCLSRCGLFCCLVGGLRAFVQATVSVCEWLSLAVARGLWVAQTRVVLSACLHLCCWYGRCHALVWSLSQLLTHEW